MKVSYLGHLRTQFSLGEQVMTEEKAIVTLTETGFQVTPNLDLKMAMLLCKLLEEKCKAVLKGFVDRTFWSPVTTGMMVADVGMREGPSGFSHPYQNPGTNVGPLLRWELSWLAACSHE